MNFTHSEIQVLLSARRSARRIYNLDSFLRPRNFSEHQVRSAAGKLVERGLVEKVAPSQLRLTPFGWRIADSLQAVAAS